MHSPADGHGAVSFLGITNTASVNIVCQYFCGTESPLLLGKHPRMESLGCTVDISNFLRNCQTFSKVDVLFYIATTSV